MIKTGWNCGWRTGILVALTFIILSGLHKVNATDSNPNNYRDLEYENLRNEYALMKLLIPVLNQVGMGARIYYTTDCSSDLGSPNYPYPFPETKAQPPSEGVSGLAAVRELFAADKNVEVSENPPSVINIVIGKPSTTIFQTHITEIKLEPEATYDPLFSLFAIRDNDEVRAAAQRLGIHFIHLPLDYLPMRHEAGKPFLAGPLKSMTMDQALGIVALTFKTIVLYSTCTKQDQHYVALERIGGPDFDVSSLLPPPPQ